MRLSAVIMGLLLAAAGFVGLLIIANLLGPPIQSHAGIDPCAVRRMNDARYEARVKECVEEGGAAEECAAQAGTELRC